MVFPVSPAADLLHAGKKNGWPVPAPAANSMNYRRYWLTPNFIAALPDCAAPTSGAA